MDFNFNQLLQEKKKKKLKKKKKKKQRKMVAEAEIVCQQNMGVLDVKFFPNKGSNIHEIGGTRPSTDLGSEEEP